METNVLITTEGYIVMCQSETQPIDEIIWIVNVLRIPTILLIEKSYCPIVADFPIFLLLLSTCNHMPPLAFKHEVERFVVFCHFQSFLLYFFCSARVAVLTNAAFVLVCPSCPSCIHYTSERVAVRPFFFRKACGQQGFYCFFHFIIHYSTLSTLIGSPLSLQVNVSPR